MRGTAVFSDDGLYRYELTRDWGECYGECTDADIEREGGHHELCPAAMYANTLVWILLNPSTADAEQDDPTIRRCIGYSKQWGYAGLVILNLFAFRSTDPKLLGTVDDPVGPDNDAYFEMWLNGKTNPDGPMCAWGAGIDHVKRGHVVGRARARAVKRRIASSGRMATCLGTTRQGHPKHPLYLRSDLPWEVFPVL